MFGILPYPYPSEEVNDKSLPFTSGFHREPTGIIEPNETLLLNILDVIKSLRERLRLDEKDKVLCVWSQICNAADFVDQEGLVVSLLFDDQNMLALSFL